MCNFNILFSLTFVPAKLLGNMKGKLEFGAHLAYMDFIKFLTHLLVGLLVGDLFQVGIDSTRLDGGGMVEEEPAETDPDKDRGAVVGGRGFKIGAKSSHP